MKTSESITKISAALLKAQSSMGNAVKGASNPYFKSSFADLNSIREAVTPALNANGITLLQPTTFVEGKYFVETVLLHESGEFLSSLTEIVAAKVNDPQATGSAISYGRRYGLQSFLSVGAVDDDGEASMGRTKAIKADNNTPVKLDIQAAPSVSNQSTNTYKQVPTTLTQSNADFKPSASFTKPKAKPAETKAVTSKEAKPVTNGVAKATPQWD